MLLFQIMAVALPFAWILIVCNPLFLLSWKGYGRTWKGPEASDRGDLKHGIASIARMTEWAGTPQSVRDGLKRILDVYWI